MLVHFIVFISRSIYIYIFYLLGFTVCEKKRLLAPCLEGSINVK